MGIGGTPDVNLCLTVLVLAKKGDSKMWKDFVVECEPDRKHIDAVDIAEWVGTWFHDNISDKVRPMCYCPKCRIKTHSEWTNHTMTCDICKGKVMSVPQPETLE